MLPIGCGSPETVPPSPLSVVGLPDLLALAAGLAVDDEGASSAAARLLDWLTGVAPGLSMLRCLCGVWG